MSSRRPDLRKTKKTCKDFYNPVCNIIKSRIIVKWSIRKRRFDYLESPKKTLEKIKFELGHEYKKDLQLVKEGGKYNSNGENTYKARAVKDNGLFGEQ